MLAKEVREMRTVKVEIWDERDHSVPATCTRLIGIDGEWFEADLCDVNSKQLDEELAWVKDRARKVGGQRRSTEIRDKEAGPPPVLPVTDANPAVRLVASRERNMRIRAWAEKQSGLNLTDSWDRGYIPVSVRVAYDKSHPDDPAPAYARA